MAGRSVIVLGTGGAGLRAALELYRAGIVVRVVSKGAPGASGATPSAIFSYCCAVPGDPANPSGLFRDDLLRSGLTVNDPHLVEWMCRDGYPRLQDLVQLGMPWSRSAEGDFDRANLPGHSATRAFHAGWRTGKALSTTLLKACLRAGIPFSQYHFALDVKIDEEGKIGLVMLDWLRGEAAVWECDALILATGGASAIYRLHTNPPGQTGDGMAMALRAGGEAVDMEFMQMYPTVLVHPPAVYGMEIATGRLFSAGARLLNRHGEDFYHRWEQGMVGQATRDSLARAIAREIATGGGTEAGGVYVDARNVPALMEQSRYVKFLQDLGVDLSRDMQQVAPGAHYSLGGVKVHPPAACPGMPGVFVAGEVMGGVHGANRLAGNALPETQVFGALAARESIEYLRSKPSSPVQPGDTRPRPVEQGESQVWGSICLARTRPSGRPVEELELDLREVMQQYGATIRTGPGLEEALARVEKLRRAFREQMMLPGRPGVWHPELLKAAELANMLEVAQALLACALVRTESRGAHFRDDFPDRDERFDGHNFVVRGHGEKMRVFRCDRTGKEKVEVWP
jgi:succinate dehydrogenase/fumarate reductase flavoprotein subunit